MRLRLAIVVVMMLGCGAALGQARTFARETPTEARALAAAAKDSTAYTLPPEEMRKAVALTRIDLRLAIGSRLLTLVELVLILAVGWAARMRDLALRVSRNLWVQGLCFVAMLRAAMWVANLPLSMYGHHLAVAYGFSVQGWGSWFVDKAKAFGLWGGIGAVLAVVLLWTMRRSPERWWLWFSGVAAAATVLGVFAVPYVVDPMFNTFEPLVASNPALVAQLERVVARSGLSIPPERMFLMRASAKVTTTNAYVTGFGASKRVVVWDTTVAKATPDEIALIFGHEMGHYALGHIVLGTVISCVVLPLFFWLGYTGLRMLRRRYGTAWGIRTQADWAALVALALVLYSLNLVGEPISNALSRWMEHNADVYGQEAVHGIVADPRGVGLRSFQMLGEESLDDPTPHPWMELWLDNHPPTRLRAGFARAYDPWAAGERPKYFAR
jgi:STE24 endopeptidase